MTRGNASLQMPNPLLKAILEVRLYSVRGNLPLLSYNLAKTPPVRHQKSTPAPAIHQASKQRDPQDAKKLNLMTTRGGARLMRIVNIDHV